MSRDQERLAAVRAVIGILQVILSAGKDNKDEE